jgi:hypothetical protein
MTDYKNHNDINSLSSLIVTESGIKGFSERNLQLFRQFYLEYPHVQNLIIQKLHSANNQMLKQRQLIF